MPPSLFVIFFLAVSAFVGFNLWRELHRPEVRLPEEANRVLMAESYCGAAFGGSNSATWPFVRLAAYPDGLVISSKYFRGCLPYSSISVWRPVRKLGGRGIRIESTQLGAPAMLWLGEGSPLFRVVAARVKAASIEAAGRYAPN
jgi:hypothetical protein